MKRFVRDYPDSGYLPQAKLLKQTCQEKLIDHEMYVADFYRSRGKLAATVMRLEGILAQFPGSHLEPEIMMQVGKTYLELKQIDKAREAFSSLVAKYPDDRRSESAHKHLKSLEGR